MKTLEINQGIIGLLALGVVIGIILSSSTNVIGQQTSSVPIWIKNNVKWWADNQTNNNEFENDVQYLINQKIINNPQVQSSHSTSTTPVWVKNTASWWSSGQISDNDFLNAIEYLVKNGMINVSTTSTSDLPKLFHGPSVGDDPFVVGFYLAEDNPDQHVKTWHWGDNTTDETGRFSAIDHRYTVPCVAWDSIHHNFCRLWPPAMTYSGYVLEWDPTDKTAVNKTFIITVNHQNYQIISGFDQRQGVIISNQTVQFSVASGNGWSRLTYDWDWGDLNEYTFHVDRGENPDHLYNTTNESFCSDYVACNNYTGTLEVSNNYTGTLNPNRNDTITDMKTFGVLVLNPKIWKPEIEVYTQNYTGPQTQFPTNQVLWFKLVHAGPNTSHTLSEESVSDTCSPNWNFGVTNQNEGQCGPPCYYPDCASYMYENPGPYTVTYHMTVGNFGRETLSKVIHIISPAISVNTKEGYEGSTVYVNGSYFPSNQAIKFYWDGNLSSGVATHVRQDGTFNSLPLTIPPLINGPHILCVKSIPWKISEVKTVFIILEPSVETQKVSPKMFLQADANCMLQKFNPNVTILSTTSTPGTKEKPPFMVEQSVQSHISIKHG